MSLLALNEVSFCRQDGAREFLVLDRVSCEVDPGELIGVFGQRRAGKSTLLRVAAGLLLADSGSVIFDGGALGGLSASARARRWRRGGIALTGGERRWFPSGQPALEFVALPLTNDGLTLRESEALAHGALERLGISALARVPLEGVSLSDSVRLGLARAIVREPRLLLFDEPATLPAPADCRDLLALLHSLANDGMAVIVASEDATALAGVPRFWTLADGRLRCTDSRRRVIPLFPGGLPERRVAS